MIQFGKTGMVLEVTNPVLLICLVIHFTEPEIGNAKCDSWS